MSHPGLDRALAEVSQRLDSTRVDLEDARRPGLRRALAEQIHANAYVQMGAALESGIKDMLRAVIAEINYQSVSFCNLRLSLFALIGDAHFQSISVTKKRDALRRRVTLMSDTANTACCTLNEDVLPLDGRTIRRDHLDLIWEVFGFEGDALCEPRHQFVLSTVAEQRNEVAHGEATASAVAGRQTIEATLSHLEQVETALLHFYLSAQSYLDKSLFLR